MRVRLCVLLVSSVAVACASGPAVETGAAAQARATVVDFVDGLNAGDLDSAVFPFAREAVWRSLTGPITETRAGIAERLDVLLETYEFRLRLICDSQLTGADSARVVGSTVGERRARDGRPAQPIDEPLEASVRRNAAGRWRIEELLWRPGEDIPAAGALASCQ